MRSIVTLNLKSSIKMTLPIKSILSCLVILATTSDIYTQEIQTLDSPQELVEIPEDWSPWKFLLGSGAEPSQLPILMYSPKSGPFNVIIYIESTKKCDFTFPTRKDTSGDAETIKQLSDNKIVFTWHQIKNKQTIITTISLLDIGTCTIKQNVEFVWEVAAVENHVEVVTFIDGFDVFTSRNSRASYDNDGNKIGDPEYFPIYSRSFSISKAADKLRFNGFFITDYTAAVLKLVEVDGKLDQTLLKSLPAEVFINDEQLVYSVCSYDTNSDYVVNCYQYDHAGINTLNNQAKIEFSSGKLDVKNLARGKLVFVAWNIEGNKLNFVEMGPENQVKIWTYTTSPLYGIFDNVRLMNFNERDRTFLTTYVSGIEVLLQKFLLVS